MTHSIGAVIVADTKDWTWVLERRCADCGFDAAACAPAAVPELTRNNVAEWRRLADAGGLRAGRPNDRTWSSLEYACHVRDVYRRYHDRIALMLTEDDPLFPNWDQDVSAVEDRYEAQNPAEVIEQLAAAGERVAAQLEDLVSGEWNRPGRRSDGASFTVATIARYMVHDPIHHLWDVAGQRR